MMRSTTLLALALILYVLTPAWPVMAAGASPTRDEAALRAYAAIQRCDLAALRQAMGDGELRGKAKTAARVPLMRAFFERQAPPPGSVPTAAPVSCAPLLREMLQRGGRARYKDTGRRGLLHAAARYGDVGMIELLLARGLDVDMRTKQGATPLKLAKAHAREAAAEVLLAAGADPSCSTKRRPIKRALKRGSEAIADKELKEQQPTPNKAEPEAVAP
jgi:hypothetical protein